MPKVTSYTDEPTPVAADIVYLAKSPFGAGMSRKVTLGNLAKALQAATVALNGVIIPGAQTLAGQKIIQSQGPTHIPLILQLAELQTAAGFVILGSDGVTEIFKVAADGTVTLKDSLIIPDYMSSNVVIQFGNGGAQLYSISDAEFYIDTGVGIPLQLYCRGGVIFNDGGFAVNFRMESNNDENNFFSDGTNDRIGFGTGTPSEKVDVIGRIKASAGIQSLAVAVTATADGLTTGLIPAGSSRVSIASGGNANNIATLPTAVVGNKITVFVDATGCEIRTPAASNATINTIDSDGTNELALVANSTVVFECRAANTWIAYGWNSLGAALSALVPDPA